MITAKEFLKKHAPCSTEGFMIEFAKMHVKAALDEASKEAQAGSQYSHHTGEFEDIPVYIPYVVKNSILNSYPESNIK